MEQQDRPRTGIGIMIFKDGKILLGKRKGSHGSGEYAFPGGYLEHMESFEDCAIRETREEAGIEIQNIRFLFLANVTKYAPKHFTHIGLIADLKSGEAQVMEPEKLESWDWYDVDNLPTPMFETCVMAIDSYKKQKNYYDQKDWR